MIECFESNINQALMMDIAVPLVQHLIPETIPNFSEQNNSYLQHRIITKYAHFNT